MELSLVTTFWCENCYHVFEMGVDEKNLLECPIINYKKRYPATIPSNAAIQIIIIGLFFFNAK